MIFKQIYLTHRWDLTGTTNPGQSGPRSIGNEDVHHTQRSSWAGAFLSDTV